MQNGARGGRVFQPSRRDVIRTLGSTAAAGLAVAGGSRLWGQNGCAVLGSPSLTEGPYFVDEDLNRSDIRVDPVDGSVRPGLPVSLAINVSQLTDCSVAPLTGAYVDIWHCDALGVYSDVGQQSSTGRKFLRGYQPTDRHGNAYFLTVYPGWYQGRAVHIHVKIRVFRGYLQTYEFTSQFFFDEAFTDEVYRLSPYSGKGNRDTLNSTDGIYRGGSSTGTAITSNSGSHLMLALRGKQGWVEADAKLICDLSLGSSPDQTPGGPGGPGMPGPGPGPGTPP